MLDDGRLVEHDAREPVCIKPMQPIVVRDRDSGLYVCAVRALTARNADLRSLFGRLRGHCQRSQDQHVASPGLDHCISESQLHARFPKPGIGEDRRATALERPCRQVNLMREQPGRKIKPRQTYRPHVGQLLSHESIVAHPRLAISSSRIFTPACVHRSHSSLYSRRVSGYGVRATSASNADAHCPRNAALRRRISRSDMADGMKKPSEPGESTNARARGEP